LTRHLRMLTILATTTVPTIYARPQSAQPSLADTEAFLNDHLAGTYTQSVFNSRDGGNTEHTIAQQGRASDCKLFIARLLDNQEDYRLTVDFKTIRAIRQESAEIITHVRRPDNEPEFVEVTIHAFDSVARGDKELSFFVNDKAMAHRMINAFLGYSKLCGAKEEPY